MKTNKLLVPVLVLLSFLFAACGSPQEPTFPTGEFVTTDTTNRGLLFNEDGTFSIMEGSTTLAIGKYSVDGDIFTAESDSLGCLTPKNIKYTFDGTNLTFNYVDNPPNDPCGGRHNWFDNVTYVPAK